MRRSYAQNFVPPEAIEKARSIDLLTYLRTYEPFEIFKESCDLVQYTLLPHRSSSYGS